MACWTEPAFDFHQHRCRFCSIVETGRETHISLALQRWAFATAYRPTTGQRGCLQICQRFTETHERDGANSVLASELIQIKTHAGCAADNPSSLPIMCRDTLGEPARPWSILSLGS